MGGGHREPLFPEDLEHGLAYFAGAPGLVTLNTSTDYQFAASAPPTCSTPTAYPADVTRCENVDGFCWESRGEIKAHLAQR